ncbi:MAG TPA: HAD hydrolase-like protein [Bryobacteraceae bacterium]|nr:HAD hydrolase-like protein [Bryobacteraceae bacterium]
MEGVIVFDMDGVLVDVSQSYRETVRATVRHFGGPDVSQDRIQDYKNSGGWNNDWALTQKILADSGIEVAYDTVVKEFNRIFFGENNDGLMQRERWIVAPGVLERLAEQYAICIFTGRLQFEAQMTLDRFCPNVRWSKIVADDNVARSKPAPDGLLDILAAHPNLPLTYIGDTIDDARSAQAASVRFVGIAHRNQPKRDELVGLLWQHGAVAVLENVNELEAAL